MLLGSLLGGESGCIDEQQGRLSRMGIDVIMRGVPLPWMMQVIPMAGHVLWNGFITDLVFWVAIVFAVLTVILHFSTRKGIRHEIPRTG
jgi:hypothetical protein